MASHCKSTGPHRGTVTCSMKTILSRQCRIGVSWTQLLSKQTAIPVSLCPTIQCSTSVMTFWQSLHSKTSGCFCHLQQGGQWLSCQRSCGRLTETKRQGRGTPGGQKSSMACTVKAAVSIGRICTLWQALRLSQCLVPKAVRNKEPKQ